MPVNQSQTPYSSKNGQPRLRRSVVAFLDILGFQDFVTDAIKQKRERSSLLELQVALDRSIRWLRPSKRKSLKEPDTFVTRTFTDNIVIGFPIEKRFDSELPLGLITIWVALFQLEMVLSGFFVRGAITIGNLYVGTDIVFGNGLLEAYQTEKELALDPRIVLGKSACRDLATHIGYYAKPRESPQYSEWLSDADDQIFLNYLEIFYGEADYDIAATSDMLTKHRVTVEKKLETYKRRPNLWNKYAWVGRYHNYFCHSHKGVFPGLRINSKKLSLRPARIL